MIIDAGKVTQNVNLQLTIQTDDIIIGLKRRKLAYKISEFNIKLKTILDGVKEDEKREAEL